MKWSNVAWMSSAYLVLVLATALWAKDARGEETKFFVEKGVKVCTIYEDQSKFTKTMALDLVSCILLPCYQGGEFYVEYMNKEGEREFIDLLKCRKQRTMSI